MAKRQVKQGIFQGSGGSEKDVLLGLKTLAVQSTGFLEQGAKVSPRKAAAVARSKLEEGDQVIDEVLQGLEMDIKTEDQATGRKETGKTALPEGERVGSPTYSDPLSPRPSESSPVGSPLSTATSVSPTHKRARPHLNHPPGGGTCPPVVRTRRGSSVEHSQSSSEDGSRLPPSSNARYARNPSKLMPLGNGDRAVVIGDKAVVTLVSDVPEIPSVRPKRGPFHRGSQKVRPAPQGEAGHPTLTPPSLPIPLTSVVAKTTTPPAPPPTSGMAGSSDLVRSPLTRSSSAALKSVEFISLPGRKRRRRGEEGSGGGDPAGVSPLDSTSPEVDPPKMGLGSAESPAAKSDRDGSSPVDTPLIKRKRGRPPKKRREMVGPLTSTGPQSADTFVPSESCGGGGGDGTPTQSAPDTHSSPMSVASAGGMAGNSVIGRLSTPSPQTILVFEESPLPPAVSMKPSVEHHVGQRGGDPGQRGDLGPVLLGKVGETVTKATPTAKAALPDINLPLWESFNTKQVCSQEQKAGSDINRTTTVQSALKPGRLSEFGCVAMPTIPSLLPQTAPKTTSSQLPLHCSASDLVHSTYANSTPSAPSSTPSAPSSTFSASSSSITISTSSTHNTSESKHEPLLPVVCVEQPNARLVKPNGHTPSIPPLTLAPVGGSCDTPVTAPHAAEEKREVAVKEGGRGKGEEQQPKKVGVVSAEVLSEVKEQRHTDAHDGAAIASAPDGESPAKPEGEKAEAMGAEPSYLTKPAPSPPSVGYKPKDPSRQDRPLDSSAAPAPTLHAPPPAQPNKSSGERKDAEPSWDQKVPSNATAQEPDSKPPRSKTIQDPELPVAPPTSLCYTLANPVAHYPPSSYPYGSTYPLVYPPSNAPPIYPPYYPSQQMPTAYLPGLHPPLSTEQTSGYYATPLSQVTSRPLAAAPVATTVSGVRVAILDKPPPQLPPTQGGRPFVGTSGGSFPPQPPGEHSQPPTSRPFMSAEPQPGLPGRVSQPHPHPLSQTYRPGMPMVSTYMPSSFYPPYVDWVVSGEREPAPPPSKPAPVKAQDPKLPPTEEHLPPTQPVECPECGRMFKNNKALNGHMRLHGGFDWTKKPYAMGVSVEGGAKGTGGTEEKPKAKRFSEASKNNSTAGAASRSPSPTAIKSEHHRSHPQPKVFTFNHTDGVKVKRETSESTSRHHRYLNSTEHRNPTLDDLCRAVEELERKEKEATSDVHRHRPSNINIPPSGGGALIERERRKLSVSPPYTPPPILSPARGSMSLLASPQIQPHTPNRILSHWNGRRNTTDSLKPSDSEDGSFMEPDHHLSTYNYISTKKWSARERQQFRRAWRVHRKQFKFLRESCAQVGSTKTLPEIIEHYYTWKKYRNDEYRCRNRHASEEILTDDDDTYPEVHSSSSSGSTEQETTHAELHRHGDKGASDQNGKHDKLDFQTDRAEQKIPMAPLSTATSADPAEHLPVVYAPHTPRPSPGQPVHQYKCKYPGCNQVFTSIFALNGHIRIHGGSWYPKPYKADSCSSSSGNSHGNSLSTLSPGQMYSSGKLKSLGEDPRLYHHPHYELTKVLSLEVPQQSGPFGLGCNNTPSPRPSPGKPRSPAKKKMSSSSPGEREGYYPCNRCGRVFTKVKSRSAHMKSHIIKQS